MKRIYVLAAACVVAISAGAVDADGVRLILAGDSTMQRRKPEDKAGSWGEALAAHLRDGVEIVNCARGGRSTRTFAPDWGTNVVPRIRQGDWVLIQFGHNDMSKASDPKIDRQTDPDTEYPNNLRRFVADVRLKGGNPVLVTSISLYLYGKSSGKWMGRNPLSRWVESMKRLAAESKTPLIDLNAATFAAVRDAGAAKAAEWYMISVNGKDWAHPTKAGAKRFAELFVQAAYDSDSPITALLRKEDDPAARVTVDVRGKKVHAEGAKVADAAESGFDREKFRNPDSLFSPGYFWMWNTKLNVPQLKSQLDDMVAHGVRSVCVHPFPADFRPGQCQSEMSPDYLSPEYLDVFAQVVDHMEKLGMSTWLYDEGGWPSGGVCGQIAKEDAAGRFRQRFYGPGPKGTEGKNRVWVREYGKGRQSYPSMIEPGATERFIEKTHEAYRKVVGRYFGKTIKFAFTDEPGMPCDYNGTSMGWCSDFADEFRVRKGYDFMPHADAVLANKHTFDADTVKYRLDYLEVRSQLFAERFLGVVQDWCHRNGLRSSGHMDGEDIPEAATRYGYGSLFDSYRAMDVPGVDVIWRQLYPTTLDNPGAQPPFPRYASSVGHQKGERLALSESFGIYGDSFSPGLMKWLVDYQMVRGINLFVFGYYAVSNAGQWMNLFEPHSGPVTPGWDFQRPYFDYIARTASILAEGEPTAEIAVYFDNRAFWVGGMETEVAARLHYAAATALDRANCEYEFVDDRALANAEVVGGRLRVGRMSYSTLVLPSSRWMSEKARDRLDAFRKAGGTVLTVEEIGMARPACRIRGRFSGWMRVAKRVKGNETLYFLVNESPHRLPPLEIELGGAEGVVRADPATGRFLAVDAQKGNRFNWRFPPYGSAIFITGAKPDAAAEPYFDYDIAPEKVRCLAEGWTMKPLVRHKAGQRDFEIAPVTGSREHATDLSDWRRVLGSDFSGKVLYRVEFDCVEAEDRWLDLGDVKWCCDAKFNGKALGPRFFGPYRWRVKTAKGRNVLEVTVANMLCNALGDDVRDRIARDFPPRSGYDIRQRTFDRENNESGLFGPVTLR